MSHGHDRGRRDRGESVMQAKPDLTQEEYDKFLRKIYKWTGESKISREYAARGQSRILKTVLRIAREDKA